MIITITGATGKIGKELTLLLAKPGNKIVLAYKSNSVVANKLKSRSTTLGAEVKLIRADLSNNNDIKKLFKIIPNILIHTAGTFPKGKWGETCKRAYNDAMTDNLESTFFLIQEASKKMNKGKIIILTDTCTNKFYKNFVPYCLAKAGIEVLIKGIKHLLPKGLKVTTFSPYISGKHKNIGKKTWNKLSKKSVRPFNTAGQIIKLIKT